MKPSKKNTEKQISFWQSNFTEQVKCAVIATDTSNIILTWNLYAEKMLLWKSREAIGKDLFELLNIRNRNGNQLKDWGKLKNTYVDGDYNLTRKDQSIIFVHLTRTYLRKEQMNLLDNVFIINITDAKLNLWSDLYLAIKRMLFQLDNAPVGFIEWDQNFIITRWNQGAENIYGWSSSETIGKSIMDFNIIYEDDIPIVNNTVKKLMNDTSKVVINEIRNNTKEGIIKYCEWKNAILHDEENIMVSVMSIVADITAKRQVEHELKLKDSKVYYQLITDNTYDWEIFSDSRGKLLYSNPAMERITGYSNMDFLNGSINYREIIHPDDIDFIILYAA